MTVAVVVGVFVIVALLVTLVLVTVLFLKALQTSADTINRVHERDQKHVTALVDRLIAGDYRTFREYPDQDEEGGQELPEDEEIKIVGGQEFRSTEQHRQDAEEELMIREDFPEVFNETG